jgi:hypothetical protein
MGKIQSSPDLHHFDLPLSALTFVPRPKPLSQACKPVCTVLKSVELLNYYDHDFMHNHLAEI